MHEVEDLGNRLKLERTVSLKKSDALRWQSEDSSETTAQFIELYYRLIDPHRAIRCDLHDDGFPRIGGKPNLLAGDNHENHQQHQQNIDERNAVDVRVNSAPAAKICYCHEAPRSRR